MRRDVIYMRVLRYVVDFVSIHGMRCLKTKYRGLLLDALIRVVCLHSVAQR